jgi:hypothetical protein
MCGIVGFVQEVKYLDLDNRVWVRHPDLLTFARNHFYEDHTAARDALDMVVERLGDCAGGKIIKGEVDHDLAPHPSPEILSIEEWNMTFDQYRWWKEHRNNDLYYAPYDVPSD